VRRLWALASPLLSGMIWGLFWGAGRFLGWFGWGGMCGCWGPAGLALETQDNNLQACRFYQRMGFRLEGDNTMLYKNFRKPVRDETALFWYLLFS
jgi:hypothetical protein